MENSYFKQKRSNFTIVSSNVLKDKDLSLKAKGLFALILTYISIPDFVLYKSYLMDLSSDGTNSFNTAWKELKDAGYLTVEKKSNGKGFVYIYDIKEERTSISDPSPKGGFSTPGKPTHGKSNDSFSTSTKTDSIIINTELDLLNNNLYQSNQSNSNNAASYDKEYFNNLKNKDIDRWMDIVKEDISKNENKFTFDDYYDYAYNQLNAKEANIYANYTDKPIEAINEWITSMAEIYSNVNDYITIGQQREKTINAKQRLLKLNHYAFAGILIQFCEKAYSINNPAAYMKTMLLNGASSSGYTQSFSQVRNF